MSEVIAGGAVGTLCTLGGLIAERLLLRRLKPKRGEDFSEFLNY